MRISNKTIQVLFGIYVLVFIVQLVINYSAPPTGLAVGNKTAIVYYCNNHQPYISASNCTNSTYVYTIYNCFINASDSDYSLLVYTSNNSLFSIDRDTGEILFIANNSYAGTIQVAKITVDDYFNCSNSQNSTLISVNISSLCGDGICSPDEDWQTCPEDCVRPYEPVATPAPSGGSGRAGGGVISAEKPSFSVKPDLLRVYLIRDGEKTADILLSNNGTANITIKLSIEGEIKNLISISKTKLILGPGESEEVYLVISGHAKEGVYAGKVVASVGSSKQEIPLIVEIESKKKYYDVRLYLPEEKVMVGERINPSITIIDLLRTGKVRATLTYMIKDSRGVAIHSETETIEIEDQQVLHKSIKIPKTKSGTYTFAVKIVYEKSVATASSTFKVLERKTVGFYAAGFKMNLVRVAVVIVAVLISVIATYVIKQLRWKR